MSKNNVDTALALLGVLGIGSLAAVFAVKRKKKLDQKESKTEKAFRNVKEKLGNLDAEIKKLEKLSFKNAKKKYEEELQEKDIIIEQLCEDITISNAKLDVKKQKEYELRCAVTKAIEELIKTRNSDSEEYIKEKIESCIAILDNTNE